MWWGLCRALAVLVLMSLTALVCLNINVNASGRPAADEPPAAQGASTIRYITPFSPAQAD